MKHGKILLLVSSVAVAVLFFALVVFTAFAPSYADVDSSPDSDFSNSFSVREPYEVGSFYHFDTSTYTNYFAAINTNDVGVSLQGYTLFYKFYYTSSSPITFLVYCLDLDSGGSAKYISIEKQSDYYYTGAVSIPYNTRYVRLDFNIKSDCYFFLGSFYASSPSGDNYGFYSSLGSDFCHSIMYNGTYEAGYNKGYTDGKDAGLSSQLSNPVGFFLTPLDSFMNIDIFGAFSLGDMFSVILFVCVALIFIKVFAGD